MKTPHLPSLTPEIRLFGKVSLDMLSEFFRQQAEVKTDQPIVFELSTSGGDADVGRRLACELRLWQQQGTEIFFQGKTFVYSAGITIMAAIPPTHRFLSKDCELLIHERKLKKEIFLDGALRGCRSLIHDVLAEIESGQRLEREGFSRLVNGSNISMEELEENVFNKDWYLTANQALDVGLIAGIV